MNVDPSKATGNGCVPSSSASGGSKPYLANGALPDKSNSLINDLSFPPGGVPSLHLPVVEL